MINCNNCRTLMDMFLDGTLSTADEAEVKSHIHICVDCQMELEEKKRKLRKDNDMLF